MGLKHLRNIENLMRKDLAKAYSKTEIRDTLRIDYQTVLDVLAYLLSEKKITKAQKIGEVEKFKWGSKC
ncbi:MAG: hypothetical protein V3V78_00435 [Candidatus Woesearchaeota archaeon]